MSGEQKTPVQILNEHTPLGKGYHSSWIITAMQAYADQQSAAYRAALNECRAWLDNSLNDMEENGESPGSWTVIQTKALFDKCDKLLSQQEDEKQQ